MSADLIHVGHIHLLQVAAKYGKVVVGLLSNEAIESYNPLGSVNPLLHGNNGIA